MKEKRCFRSAPFFLLKGSDADEPTRFGFFSTRTLLKPPLGKRESGCELLSDVMSASDTHEIHTRVAENLQDVSSLIIRLAAVFRKALTLIQEGEIPFFDFFEMKKKVELSMGSSQEETILSHILSHYPKREFDLKKIVDALPEPCEEEIPATLLVSCAIGALSQKGLDEGEFFIEIKGIASSLKGISPFLRTLDETKQEIIEEFISEGRELPIIDEKTPLSDLLVRQRAGRTSIISKKSGCEVTFKRSGQLSEEHELLSAVSQMSVIDPASFFTSPFFKGCYVPRLRYDRTIVSAARWHFDASLIDEEELETSIRNALETYELDDVCYLFDGSDLRLVLWREEMPYLAEIFKRFKALHFVERLFSEKTVLVKGRSGVFLSEIFVPLLKLAAEANEKTEVERLHA